MALWIQCLPLTVLLSLFTPNTQAIANQRLCGPELMDALYFVCGPMGFLDPQQKDIKAPLVSRLQGREVDMMQLQDQIKKRGIVEECCHNICSWNKLNNYCN